MTDTDSDNNYINYGEKYNLDESIFIYSIDEDPYNIFTDKKNIKILIIHNCYCHQHRDYLKDEICNVDIFNTNGSIRYIDILNECSKQYKDFLINIIKEKNLDIDYNELLCNHGFIEGLDYIEENIYYLSCGS